MRYKYKRLVKYASEKWEEMENAGKRENEDGNFSYRFMKFFKW